MTEKTSILPYEYLKHWSKYYQLVSQQYYDRFKMGRTDMDHFTNYIYCSNRSRAFLFLMIDHYANDGTLLDPDNYEVKQPSKI